MFSFEVHSPMRGMHPNIKYISQRRALQTVNIDTNLIKIGQEITNILLFVGFNMAFIGAAILNS